MDKKRQKIAYVPPQTEVFASEPLHPLAASVRSQGSGWTDGGDQTVEFNFENTGSKGSSSGTASKSVGSFQFKSVWEVSYEDL